MPEVSAGGPIRLFIIGAGKMGEAHAATFAKMPDVEIVGIVSRTGHSAAHLAARYGIQFAGDNWQTALDQIQPHGCIVAVSHSQNEVITRGVIERGIHVLAEKPVAFDSALVKNLASLAQKNRVIALAAMNRRFFPHIGAAIDYIRFWGVLRDVTLIAPDSASWRRAAGRIEDFVYDQWLRANTLHAFDLLRMVGGEISNLQGYATFDHLRDSWSIGATLSFGGGTIGHVISYSDLTRTALPWELHITTDGASAHFRPLETCQLELGRHEFGLKVKPEPDGLKMGLWYQGRAFIEALYNPHALSPLASDLADHARSLELVEQFETLNAPSS